LREKKVCGKFQSVLEKCVPEMYIYLNMNEYIWIGRGVIETKKPPHGKRGFSSAPEEGLEPPTK
jgi:hypothetical protein|tara:strand:+ start:1392 stop:1583 length:192 start_codon:yes stop_codon:yes gene_type:complete